MKLKIYTLALAVLIMGCANTSSRTPSSDEEIAYGYPPAFRELPQEIAVNYEFDQAGNQTSKFLATLDPGHVKQAFLGHISEIENIHDISIEDTPSDHLSYLQHRRIKFQVQFKDSISERADNNFKCTMRVNYKADMNQVHLSFYSCNSSNVRFKSGKHEIPGKSFSLPIRVIKLGPPELFVIE